VTDIIQIYQAKEIFTKSAYTPENRKQFRAWESNIRSTQGFLYEQTLVLPIGYKNQINLKATELIILHDIRGWESFLVHPQTEDTNRPNWLKTQRPDLLLANNKTVFAFQQTNTPKTFELFKIKKTNEDLYELFLDYTGNDLKIGFPKRDNHKIADLKPNKPIRYQINGKSDFTLTGRKERSFQEFDFIIEWIGQAHQLEFRELNKLDTNKNIPIEQAKRIDERKRLS